jgi:hypothetical protein
MIQERYDLIENQALVILKDILGRNPNSVGEFNAWKTLFIAIDNKQKLHKDNIEDIASICSDLYNECYDHAKDLFGEIKDEHYTFINNRFIELKKYK